MKCCISTGSSQFAKTKTILKERYTSVFLQDQNFLGSLMTPCLKIWGSLANLEGQNFFMYNNFLFGPIKYTKDNLKLLYQYVSENV